MNIQRQPDSSKPLMSDRRVMILGAVLVAIGPISMALYTPAMPEIVRAFDTTEAAVKLTLTLYFAGFAFAQLICGPLSDGFGRRPVTIAFLMIYLLASIVALVSPDINTLIAARFLQGVGAAVGVAIARAIVRDLFTHERSARIMNMIGMILAVAPAFSPLIGGITTEAFGWHALFLVMVIAGCAIMVAVYYCLRETVTRDLSRIRPMAIVRSYATLLSSRYFLLSSAILGSTVGSLYTLATLLPFVLIQRGGLTGTQFGLAMLMQSGSYFLGSVAVRLMLPKLGSRRLVPIGIGLVLFGTTTLAILMRVTAPSFMTVMVPIAFIAHGIAYIIPAMTTASLAPFPHIAGAAAALSGFMQMGGGMLGSIVAVAIGDPVIGLATVIPAMGFVSALCWLAFRRLPDPLGKPVAPIPTSI